MNPDDRMLGTPDDDDFNGFYDPGDDEDIVEIPSHARVNEPLVPVALPTSDRQFETDLEAFTSQGLTFGADGYECPDHRLDDSAFAGRSIVLSPLLRSAVASVGVVVRTWHNRKAFPVHHGRHIQFTGYRIYQQDLLPPLRLGDLLRGRSTRDAFEISIRDTVRWLGWSCTAHSRTRLLGSLLSIALARFEVTNLKYERTRFRLFDALHIQGDSIVGKLSGGMVKFQDAMDGTPRGTYVPLEAWRSLRPGLETWLAGWVLATKCDAPIAIQTLYDQCGTCHQHVGEFGRDVRRALDRLKAVGLVTHWTQKPGDRMTRGFITIRKPTRRP